LETLADQILLMSKPGITVIWILPAIHEKFGDLFFGGIGRRAVAGIAHMKEQVPELMCNQILARFVG
jgi:hypothetical protein